MINLLPKTALCRVFFHVLVCNAVLQVRRMKAYPFLCLLLAASLQSSLRAGDSVWPGWLGPERNGRVKGFDPPVQWPAELKPKWSVQVGSGYGTAVVSDGKAFVHSRQGEKEMVRAIDLVSGKVLWTKAYPALQNGRWQVSAMARAPRPILPIPTGVFSPPAFPVFSRLGRRIRASCFGERSRKRFGQPYAHWGATNSPLILGDRIINLFGNDEEGT